MRLKSFGVRRAGPIREVSVDDLADVVVLAGPNGVGKTSVLNALLQIARQPLSYAHSDAEIWLTVDATNELEKTKWGKMSLDTRLSHDASLLQGTLQTSRKRNKFNSSFLNFDSDRAVRNIQPFHFSWDVGNPFVDDVGWDLGLGSLSDRYNDVRHSLFRLVENQRKEVADRAFQMRDNGQGSMALDFPDVLVRFKDAFRSLLGPKELQEVNTRDQAIYYRNGEERLNIETLSSGEREVVNIVFDFLLRNPSDCIIVFDEPELHLHPELSYRLLQTLSASGRNNQFIFSTHSPEIISASLENTVVFVRPPAESGGNQAIVVHREDETHSALQTLGQSIGVISLGKKLVLIEGGNTSLDKQTYGAILRNRFPELILVPIGGRGALRSFEDIKSSVIGRTIWGVEFFLLCDRDAVNSLGPEALAASSEGSIKVLNRYHLENYFLDEHVIARAFASMEDEGSWLRDPSKINDALRSFAKDCVPYAVALNVAASFRERVGNVTLMPKNLSGSDVDDTVRKLCDKAREERGRVAMSLDEAAIEKAVRAEFERLTKAVADDGDAWRRDIPGRPVLNKFASKAGLRVGRLKQLYLGACDQAEVFSEIVSIFESFSSANAKETIKR